MRFGVLGPLRVDLDGGTVGVCSRMERALLAVLLSRVNEVVTTSALTEALWRDRPPRAVGNALQTIVHRLRRRLSDPRRVVYQRPGYTLVAQSGEVDVLRFERMVAEARQTRESGKLADAVSAYRDGLKLWRGDPYDDFPDIPLLYTEIARLRERRLAVIEEMIDVELRLGNHADVAAQLPALIAENPLREVFYAQLMRAFYGCQRQADALQVYQDARRALSEIGLDPGVQLQELEIAVLRGTVGRVAIPPQLPATAAAFTGRGDHLRQLDELLDHDAETTHLPIAVITGTAGVGKTTLALHWAHRVRTRFPDGQLYIDLHGCSSVREQEPDVVLGQFLRALGVAVERVPGHLAEAAAMFRSIVAANGCSLCWTTPRIPIRCAICSPRVRIVSCW